MSREKILFIVAVLTMIAPHLGLTNLMEQITLFVFGLIILVCAYGIYFEKRSVSKTKVVSTNSRKRTPKAEYSVPISKKENHLPEHGFKIINKKEDQGTDDVVVQESNHTI